MLVTRTDMFGAVPPGLTAGAVTELEPVNNPIAKKSLCPSLLTHRRGIPIFCPNALRVESNEVNRIKSAGPRKYREDVIRGKEYEGRIRDQFLIVKATPNTTGREASWTRIQLARQRDMVKASPTILKRSLPFDHEVLRFMLSKDFLFENAETDMYCECAEL
ncbi:hypothetical protein Micbo1qcDRAFT_57379 [Microdochium bolleyi]|uniref:Uncharacterized protein n=1 Tax=Microdochium bolleyi TaxID=196109 RepID=A0A136J3N5_9PEZI|nr:hypothetical protein Micbo1qcDRAFT_57379 [Microdochium bolleyi]